MIAAGGGAGHRRAPLSAVGAVLQRSDRLPPPRPVPIPIPERGGRRRSLLTSPVATSPDALVFGTGFVPQRDMIRAGAVLNAVCIVVLSLWGWFVLR